MTRQERDQLAVIVFSVAMIHCEMPQRNAFYQRVTPALGFNGVVRSLAVAAAILWEETDAKHTPEASLWVQHDFTTCVEIYVGLITDRVVAGDRSLFDPTTREEHCRKAAREALRQSCC